MGSNPVAGASSVVSIQEPDSMAELVTPRLGRGLRDLLPADMLTRQRLVDTVRGVYERYGFVPLETPAIEYLDALSGSGGDEIQQSLFRVANPDSEESALDLGLRFDLTVPLARVVAQYQELPKPFRRYQVSKVWRGDKPDPGRFREFMQFDLDSVGVESNLADTEIIAAMCDTLEAIEAGPYVVRFSSRAVLNLLMPYTDIPEGMAKDVFRVLDKLDRVGLDKVKRELGPGYTDKSGDKIFGLDLPARAIEGIERFLEIEAEDRDEVVDRLRDLFGGVEGADAAIDSVAVISRHLDALGYGSDHVRLDLSIARGLAYYTGPVYEAVLLDATRFGSVFGGGRYDSLVERFLGESIPATGASMGVDRVLAALQHMGRASTRKSTAQVLVCVIDDELIDDCIEMTWRLRRQGVPTELYLESGVSVGKQLKYADRTGIPFTVMFGGDEKSRGTVTVKDMEKGAERSTQISDHDTWIKERPGQVEVPLADLVDVVKELLAATG